MARWRARHLRHISPAEHVERGGTQGARHEGEGREFVETAATIGAGTMIGAVCDVVLRGPESAGSSPDPRRHGSRAAIVELARARSRVPCSIAEDESRLVPDIERSMASLTAADALKGRSWDAVRQSGYVPRIVTIPRTACAERKQTSSSRRSRYSDTRSRAMNESARSRGSARRRGGHEVYGAHGPV